MDRRDFLLATSYPGKIEFFKDLAYFIFQERQAMERSYAAACRRLSGDWRALERGWGSRRRALRQRQREITARAHRLRSLSETHQQCVSWKYK